MYFERPTALRMVAGAETALPDLVQEVIAICQIPAPTFHEEQRAAYVARRMVEVGLREVSRDAAGNVIGRLRGRGTGPNLLLAAHLDTVFPVETDVTVRVDGEILRAPGVGDNSASVATMLHAARLLVESDVSLAGDVIFAATCGEEGLGNLEGMRAIVRALQEEIDYVIALDGSLGGMVREAVGSRRFRLVVTTSGGHSWGAFGAPSAIHSLGRIIARISELRVPAHPKTTYNVGLISGGTSVNTIAARAEAVLDLRSLDRAELIRLEERVQRIIRAVERETGVKASLELLGDRPTGAIPDEHPLCNLVRAVHRELGLQTRTYPSSTDGNVPLSMGIPAVTVGVTLGGNGHRLDEYIYTSPLARGLAQVLLLVLGVQELPLRAR
ncbi:M20/M25/M40 family metallo-hydrolase [Symbiobacterium terraclitae]|uniref:M20/M25/M40 family metallo-hydrolase n=1 Tax=Symbiobacterium terraclitae TaxID=557451 RepID=UPI0035B53D5E